jgi:hypothetical protein
MLKPQKPSAVPNLLFASNEDWCVPATVDGRCFYIPPVSNHQCANLLQGACPRHQGGRGPRVPAVHLPPKRLKRQSPSPKLHWQRSNSRSICESSLSGAQYSGIVGGLAWRCAVCWVFVGRSRRDTKRPTPQPAQHSVTAQYTGPERSTWWVLSCAVRRLPLGKARCVVLVLCNKQFDSLLLAPGDGPHAHSVGCGAGSGSQDRHRRAHHARCVLISTERSEI